MRVQQDHTYQSRQKTTGSRRIYLPLELIQVNPFCCRGYRLRKRAPDTAISRKYKKGRPYFVWELTGETKRNEPLDCRNYAQAAIEITGLTLKEPPKKKTEVQVTRKQTRRRGNRSGGIA